MDLPKEVFITEVGPRDGFQAERAFIPTERKIEAINRLSKTGLRRIEVTSFVHPKAIPQLRDAEEVMQKIERSSGVIYRALVPNERGARRAVEAKVDELLFVVAASEAYNQKNVRMSIEDSLRQLEVVVQVAEGVRIPISVGLSTAFGCPFEGEVPEGRVLGLIERLSALGVEELYVADTLGRAHPHQISSLIGKILDRWPDLKLGLHLHGRGPRVLENVRAGLEAGVSRLEAAICGLGGSPAIPEAQGNLPTEDLISWLAERDVETGIDLEALKECAQWIRKMIAACRADLVDEGKIA